MNDQMPDYGTPPEPEPKYGRRTPRVGGDIPRQVDHPPQTFAEFRASLREPSFRDSNGRAL